MIIKITVAYDGTDFCGWQIQPNGRSVQGEISAALEKLLGRRIAVTGSGRTDSGVHASGQVASFSVENASIPPERYAAALNGLLPPDVRILDCERAPDDFNARYSAKRKTYVYRTYVSAYENPLKERYACRIGRVDAEAMRRAAALLIGTHDFRCFLAANSAVKDTTRTIYSFGIDARGDDITFTVTGNGFLYNMVRIAVGTLLAVGEGKIAPEDIGRILAGGDRKNAGRTMPAKGLTLVSVEY